MSDAARIVFAGTPEFAVPALKALAKWQPPVAVYTQPDRPAGRGRQLTASPIKTHARALGIQVRQPQSLKSSMAVSALQNLRCDLMVVAAYGLILPPAILQVPRLGCINIHASLLPRWRGAAPIQRAIMAGDTRTGISIMQMNEGLDTGDVLLKRETVITPEDTGGSLHDRLAELGAAALMDALPGVLSGELEALAQDDAAATYASKLDKSEALIDWRQPAEQLALMVRAMNPWPVSECNYDGRRLRIWNAVATNAPADGRPGKVTGFGADGIRVACGQGQLLLTELQLPGGRRQSAREFINARPVSGVQFGGREE